MSSQQAFNQILSLMILGMLGVGTFYALHLIDRLRSPGGRKHVALLTAAVVLAVIAVVAPGIALLRSEPPPYRDTRVGLEAAGLPYPWAYQGPNHDGPHWLEWPAANETADFGMTEISDSAAIYPLMLAADLGAMALLAIGLVEAGRYVRRRLRPLRLQGSDAG